jgi:protein gp37
MKSDGSKWWDVSWNPISGCSPVSAGCAHCYAASTAKRFWGARKFSDVQAHPEQFEKMHHIKNPFDVFVCSMSDLFHDAVDDDTIDEVFLEIMQCPIKHRYFILTKRPERMAHYVTQLLIDDPGLAEDLFDKVWFGISVENQAVGLERLGWLNQVPSQNKFISFEPLLGPIGKELCFILYGSTPVASEIKWVVIGAETGTNARPCKLEWIENLINGYSNIGVPVFVKNIGREYSRDMSDWPAQLKVRQKP